jgi:hypothetical protein
MSDFGFIILRHVRCDISNKYWIEAYTCIRKFYPRNKIMLIDDNSNYDFITEFAMENTTIIQSEYEGRGELLPYIYFLQNPLFEKAVIIHDSVFFQERVDFQHINLPLWHFDTPLPLIQDREKELSLISALNNMECLLEKYNTLSFKGCFGGMSIIDLNFLKKINHKYHLGNLIKHVLCRDDRMCLERVLGVIFSYELNNQMSVFGNIYTYNFHYSFDRYLLDKENKYMPMIPVIKVWTGR